MPLRVNMHMFRPFPPEFKRRRVEYDERLAAQAQEAKGQALVRSLASTVREKRACAAATKKAEANATEEMASMREAMEAVS